MMVGKYLHLYVARLRDIFFYQNMVITKTCRCLAPGRFQGFDKICSCLYPPHALTAAACPRLYHHRKADFARFGI